MRMTVSIALVLAFAAAAHASIIADVLTIYESEPIPDTEFIACVYDIVITVEDDNFTAAGGTSLGEAWAVITDGPGTFYNHVDPSDPRWPWPMYAPVPDVVFDTFVTTPDGWPNTDSMGTAPGYAGIIDISDTYIVCDWFMTGLQAADGTFVIARMTVLCGDTPSTLEIDLLYGGLDPGLYNLQRTIIVPTPEPGTAALLILGALAALRRRQSHFRNSVEIL